MLNRTLTTDRPSSRVSKDEARRMIFGRLRDEVRLPAEGSFHPFTRIIGGRRQWRKSAQALYGDGTIPSGGLRSDCNSVGGNDALYSVHAHGSVVLDSELGQFPGVEVLRGAKGRLSA